MPLNFPLLVLIFESVTVNEDVEDLVLNATERQYIEHLSGHERQYYLKSIWSAKEATAKALGLGLQECLSKLFIADEVYKRNRIFVASMRTKRKFL